MEFSVNHPILFVLVSIVIAAVLGQSIYFLVKSVRRAKATNMDMTKIKKTIITAAIFTIAPAVAIVITVVSLSQSLGIALPWLRLSVVGSLSYEAIAAANAASGMGTTLAALAGSMTASQYVTIAIVMTISIMVGIWLVPVIAAQLIPPSFNAFNVGIASLISLITTTGIRPDVGLKVVVIFSPVMLSVDVTTLAPSLQRRLTSQNTKPTKAEIIPIKSEF